MIFKDEETLIFQMLTLHFVVMLGCGATLEVCPFQDTSQNSLSSIQELPSSTLIKRDLHTQWFAGPPKPSPGHEQDSRELWGEGGIRGLCTSHVHCCSSLKGIVSERMLALRQLPVPGHWPTLLKAALPGIPIHAWGWARPAAASSSSLTVLLFLLQYSLAGQCLSEFDFCSLGQEDKYKQTNEK